MLRGWLGPGLAQVSGPRIRTTSLRIRIRIEPFSSEAFKIQQKLSLYSLFFYLLLTLCTFTSVFKDNRLSRSNKTAVIKVLLNFLIVDGRIRIR